MQTRRWKPLAPLLAALLLLMPMLGSAPSAFAQTTSDESAATIPIPGFGTPSGDVSVISAASGSIAPSLRDGATLSVERLAIEPGASLPGIDDAQILQVEQGSLSFEDDLGLDAEIDAGTSQFFAAGAETAIANHGDNPAIVIRTSISGDTREVGNIQGDARASSRPATSASDIAAIAQLAQQTADAPTEVVIEYNGDKGFDPDELNLAQGGSLIIENTTTKPCEFAIADLEIAATIEPGSIDPVVISGPAGAHDFTCSLTEGGDPVATGTVHLVRVAPTPTAEPSRPATTPEATPDVEASSTPVPATPASGGESGSLLEQEITDLPPSGQVLFAAQIVLGPGATLPLTGEAGPVALMVTGGDLTAAREGHPPGKLRDGKAVVLPTGTIATLRNDGDAPITLQIAGIGAELTPDEPSGSSEPGSSDAETGDRPGESGASSDSGADQPADMTGTSQFFPTDAEMEHLGLISSGRDPQEITEPAGSAFWFQTTDEASTLLPTWDWQSAMLQTYDSQSESTDYGEVALFAINVDAFQADSGAADFIDYIHNDMFGGNADQSKIVAALPGVDQVYNGAVYDSEKKTDLGFMVIQTGSYVITLYATGADLDATALMEDVATLILGARG